MAKGKRTGDAKARQPKTISEKKQKESQDVLTGDVADAVEYYVSGDGMWINNQLRNGEKFEGDDKRILDNLDKAADGEINDNVLYRSVDASAIFGQMSQTDYENMADTLIYGSIGNGQYAKSIADKANKTVEKAIGKEITDKGFMSTTSDKDVAMEWGDYTGSSKPVVVKFTNAKGAKGRDVSKIGDKGMDEYDKQHERLIARNTKYTPNKVYVEDGVIVVEAKFKK